MIFAVGFVLLLIVLGVRRSANRTAIATERLANHVVGVPPMTFKKAANAILGFLLIALLLFIVTQHR